MVLGQWINSGTDRNENTPRNVVLSERGTQVFPRILSTEAGAELRRTSTKTVKKLLDPALFARRFTNSLNGVAKPGATARPPRVRRELI